MTESAPAQADISHEAVEKQIRYHERNGRVGCAAMLRELRNALTASEKLLREVHITEGNQWLYSDDEESSWIERRDKLLGKGEGK